MTVPEGSDRPISLAAILAGGNSRRMGRDKAVERLGGLRLIDRVLERAAEVARELVIVGGDVGAEVLGVPSIPDRFPGANSMGGIATALAYAAETVGPQAWVLVLACDLPFLKPALLRRLARLREAYQVVVPRGEAGHEPLCALYRADVRGVCEDLIDHGNLRILDVYPRVATRKVPVDELRPVDPELSSFLNVNRPADLERARRLLETGGAAPTADVPRFSGSPGCSER